ncbi:uncharacterized protein LOC120090870 [Benincasa hispida]|uniref:uncharacterized protein LOC120090870 n=1 Tax=Benincasa hispida TaxID=102211 RepID=UPI001901F1F8|nr:uncharacterized protein LOC120090870 [Benincasa hispida]
MAQFLQKRLMLLRLLEKMAATGYNWPSERSSSRVGGIYELEKVNALKAQMATLTNAINLLSTGFSEKIPSVKALLGDFIKESRSRTNFLESIVTSYGKAIQNLEVQLHINIPFVDALEQMPNYVKLIKEMLSSKNKFEKYEMVSLNEECSAMLQKKLLQKLKDPRSFMIPYTIGNLMINKALCDLGTSINLMLLSSYRKLNIGEVQPTTISLHLADRTLTYPRGVVEDVLVKVSDLIFPTDFVVLDMEEDSEIAIILGSPFLATGRALIDVYDGELTLRVNDENMTFNFLCSSKSKEPISCVKR